MLSPLLVQTFRQLLDEAIASGEAEPTAMNLATTDASGRVSSRMVLLKGVDERGFRFFTHYESDKGRQLQAHPQVALCFYWSSVRTGVQVRVEGSARCLAEAESDAYFASRPRGSQVGAWASLQSRALSDRRALEQRMAHYEKVFSDRDVPRPPFWGGFLVQANRLEFWHGASFRLHQRTCWTRQGRVWTQQLLYP